MSALDSQVVGTHLIERQKSIKIQGNDPNVSLPGSRRKKKRCR